MSVGMSMPLGSPPPMRGKGRFFFRFRRLTRITPAHAGKRFVIAPFNFYAEDHPRPCGEKTV